MSNDNKSAVLQAMKKMKNANKKIADKEQVKSSGGKNSKGDESIAEKIFNAVSNLKGED